MFVYQLTPVRAEPRDDAEQVTQLLPGEPITAGDTRDEWVRIRTAYDYSGWIREASLGGGPDPAWLEPRVSEPLDFARTLLGSPYLWGGMTAAGIDCSGLVHMSFRAAGRLVPRDADQQEDAAEPVPADAQRPGDLVTYGDDRRRPHRVLARRGPHPPLDAARRGGRRGRGTGAAGAPRAPPLRNPIYARIT